MGQMGAPAALQNNTPGNFNSAFGYEALYGIEAGIEFPDGATGSDNTGIGAPEGAAANWRVGPDFVVSDCDGAQNKPPDYCR